VPVEIVALVVMRWVEETMVLFNSQEVGTLYMVTACLVALVGGYEDSLKGGAA